MTTTTYTRADIIPYVRDHMSYQNPMQLTVRLSAADQIPHNIFLGVGVQAVLQAAVRLGADVYSLTYSVRRWVPKYSDIHSTN